MISKNDPVSILSCLSFPPPFVCVCGWPQVCPRHSCRRVGLLIQSLLLANSQAPDPASEAPIPVVPQLAHLHSLTTTPKLLAHAYITLGEILGWSCVRMSCSWQSFLAEGNRSTMHMHVCKTFGIYNNLEGLVVEDVLSWLSWCYCGRWMDG